MVQLEGHDNHFCENPKPTWVEFFLFPGPVLEFATVEPLGGFGKTIVVVDVVERRLFDRTEPAGAVDDIYDFL